MSTARESMWKLTGGDGEAIVLFPWPAPAPLVVMQILSLRCTFLLYLSLRMSCNKALTREVTDLGQDGWTVVQGAGLWFSAHTILLLVRPDNSSRASKSSSDRWKDLGGESGGISRSCPGVDPEVPGHT